MKDENRPWSIHTVNHCDEKNGFVVLQVGGLLDRATLLPGWITPPKQGDRVRVFTDNWTIPPPVAGEISLWRTDESDLSRFTLVPLLEAAWKKTQTIDHTDASELRKHVVLAIRLSREIANAKEPERFTADGAGRVMQPDRPAEAKTSEDLLTRIAETLERMAYDQAETLRVLKERS